MHHGEGTRAAADGRSRSRAVEEEPWMGLQPT